MPKFEFVRNQGEIEKKTPTMKTCIEKQNKYISIDMKQSTVIFIPKILIHYLTRKMLDSSCDDANQTDTVRALNDSSLQYQPK